MRTCVFVMFLVRVFGMKPRSTDAEFSHHFSKRRDVGPKHAKLNGKSESGEMTCPDLSSGPNQDPNPARLSLCGPFLLTLAHRIRIAFIGY